MNKHLYLCHLLVLSSPTLMMHGHTNMKFRRVMSSGLWWGNLKGRGFMDVQDEDWRIVLNFILNK